MSQSADHYPQGTMRESDFLRRCSPYFLTGSKPEPPHPCDMTDLARKCFLNNQKWERELKFRRLKRRQK